MIAVLGIFFSCYSMWNLSRLKHQKTNIETAADCEEAAKLMYCQSSSNVHCYAN